MSNKTRWIAFILLCLGDLMIVLDSTIVNVALPSIRTSLGFSEVTLVWVVNAYILTFGGFMLLGGRLADIYGQRKLFLFGIASFTFASLLCGLANTQMLLITARAIQGIAGAIVSAVALSLIMNLFTEPVERSKAMGYFGFVMAGGGSIGVLLGGVLTSAFNWHSIFLVNLPIGISVFVLCLFLLPKEQADAAEGKLDIFGALTVTLSLMLSVYAIVNGNIAGWLSLQTLGMLCVSLLLMALFIYIESKVASPLVPLSIFRIRSVAVSNVIAVLWAGAMFAWFFIAALYMQLVLGYDPLHVGLGFLPANLIMAAFSFGLSARLVTRFGMKVPLSVGLSIAAFGLLLFAFSPVGGSLWLHVIPGMVLLGIGAGMAFNPMLLIAMSEVKESESGLASGVVNTAFMMGGALGLAIFASIAATRTASLLHTGVSELEALNSGYHLAFIAGALFAGLAALLGAVLLRPSAAVQGGTAMH